MATETQGNGGTVAAAAASAITPDPITADLLARHSAGEKLTPAEYGKVGWFASLLARGKGKPGAGGPGTGPAQSGSAPGDKARMGPMAPDQASGDSLPAVPVDPRLVQRTTESLIKAIDGIARRKIVAEAVKAGATDATAKRFDSAAGVPVASRELMVENSPDVAAALGLNPNDCPIAAFLGGLGLWATNIWLCVDELKAMQKPPSPKPDSPPAPSASEKAGPASSQTKGAAVAAPGNPS